MRATRAVASPQLGGMAIEPSIELASRTEMPRRSWDRAIARAGGAAARRGGAVAAAGDRDERTDAIEGRIARGACTRFIAGSTPLGTASSTGEARWMAAVLALRAATAVLSHRSAGQLWGLMPPRDRSPEVTRPAGSERGGRGSSRTERLLLRTKWGRSRDSGDLGVADDVRPRGVLDERELERAWNEMEVRGMTDRLSVPDLLERYPGRRGSRVLRALLGRGASRSGSRATTSRRRSWRCSTRQACRGRG